MTSRKNIDAVTKESQMSPKLSKGDKQDKKSSQQGPKCHQNGIIVAKKTRNGHKRVPNVTKRTRNGHKRVPNATKMSPKRRHGDQKGH